MLAEFDVCKQALDKESTLDLDVLFEIWGQKLETLLLPEDEPIEKENYFKELRELREAKHSISTIDRKEVKVSSICPEIIYNDKIERIRAMEYSVGGAP